MMMTFNDHDVCETSMPDRAARPVNSVSGCFVSFMYKRDRGSRGCWGDYFDWTSGPFPIFPLSAKSHHVLPVVSVVEGAK